MKKCFFKLCAIIFSVIMVVSVSGCNLVRINNERDMAQVVATVDLGDGIGKDEIYKSDLVNAYLNYGYYYSYYGYTQKQTYEMIVKNLVDSVVFVQYAMKYFEGLENGQGIENASAEKWTFERYLNTEEIDDAKNTVIGNVNNFIDGFVSEQENKVSDTYGETVRTVPTDAKNEEIDKVNVLDIGDKNGTKEQKDRNIAYNKFIKLLKDNALLGEDYDGTVESTLYYVKNLEGQQESKLVEKFENTIKEEARAKLTFDKLAEKYAEMYKTQVKGYTASQTDFVSNLSSATAKSPLVFSPYGGYGYVYNLLLGASDEQKAEIEKISNKDKAEREELRAEILKATTVKDLRASWILSGYDFDFETKKFTGDYAFLDDSIPFFGDVTLLNESEKEKEDFVPEYRVDNIKTFGLDEFIDFIDNYVYGESKTATNGNYYKTVKIDEKPENYAEKMNELLFAFSTDSGSLNTYKGYAISPVQDLDGAEKYVEEFANASRDLLDLGGASYSIVATDYGYHVLFFSEVINTDTNYETLVDYLNYLDGEEHDEIYWKEIFNDMINNFDDYEDTDSYLYILADSMLKTDTAVTDKENEISNEYRYNEKYVNVFESVYEDLIG